MKEYIFSVRFPGQNELVKFPFKGMGVSDAWTRLEQKFPCCMVFGIVDWEGTLTFG